jgi:hypothetical protein
MHGAATGYSQCHPASDLVPKLHAPGPVALPEVEVYQTMAHITLNHTRTSRLLNPSKLSQSASLLNHQQMNKLVF